MDILHLSSRSSLEAFHSGFKDDFSLLIPLLAGFLSLGCYTAYHRLSGLNVLKQEKFIFHSYGGLKSEIRVPVWSVFGKGCLHGL